MKGGLGIRIPSHYVKEFNLRNGGTVEITVEDGRIVITPPRKELHEMLSLKYLDDLERAREMEAELVGTPYRYVIDEPHHWSVWAVPKTADGEFDHNNALTHIIPCMDNVPLVIALVLASSAVLSSFIGGFAFGHAHLPGVRMFGLLMVAMTVLMLYVAHLIPAPIDPNPFAFTLTGMVFSFALFRLGFLELVPAARQVALDAVSDAFFVFDSHGRLQDMNPAAGCRMQSRRSGVPFWYVTAPHARGRCPNCDSARKRMPLPA